ncbi:hypothetical protein MMC11_000291 [Xylographa trunciseda]|nr:hypothetical protein [Xylographa trunciseda]
MQAPHQQVPYIGSPALGAKSPPLSKYFQTPPGRSSPIPPNVQGSLVPISSSESLPSLPPRPLASPSSARWDQDSSQMLDTGQQRYSPGTSLSTPFAGKSQVASYNPQHYGSIRGGPNSPLGPARASNANAGTNSDTSKWGIKYNHGYSRSQDQRPKPSLPPRPRSSVQDGFERVRSPSNSSSTNDGGGYQLRPVAYDPNPSLDVREDDRQSWKEGDDLESMQPSPPAQPPQKPPKVPQSLRQESSRESVRAAPQLPPLYFESQPHVQQQDFAYSKRAIQNGAPASGLISQRQMQPPPIKMPPQLGSSTNAARISQIARPPVPTSTGQPPDQTHQQSQIVTGLSSEERRNILHRPDDARPEQRVQAITIPRQQKDSASEDLEESNNSFYFHSPQSSTDSSHDRSPKIPAADANGLLSSKTVNSDFGLSSASALGFGGPSDWERFGDYDAEEVDDLDLYVSTKPKTAELPATASPIEGSRKEVHNSPLIAELTKPLELPPVEYHSQPEVSEPLILEKLEAPSATSYQDLPTDTTGEETGQLPKSDSPQLPLSLPGSTLILGDGPAGDEESDRESEEITPLATTHNTMTIDEPEQAAEVTTTPVYDTIEENFHDDEGRFGGRFADVKTMKFTNSDDEAEAGSIQEDSTDEAAPRPYPVEDDEGRDVERLDNVPVVEEHAQADIDRYDNASPIEGSKVDLIDGKDDDGGEDIIISLQIPDTPDEFAARQVQSNERPMERTNMETRAITTRQRGLSALDPSDNRRSNRHSYFPKSVEMEDPYANLDAWAKASLNRYVKMLHEERQADTDEERYSIFTNFTQRETQLRAVLYDMDDEQESVEQPPAKLVPLKGSASILTLRPSIRSKALPALPPGVPPSPPLNTKKSITKLETVPRPVEELEPSTLETPADETQPGSGQMGSDEQSSVPRGGSADSYVMVDSPSNEQYTPGGRPLIPQIGREESSSPLKVKPSLTSLRNALDVVGTQTTGGSRTDGRSPGLSTPLGSASTISNVKLSEAPRSNSVPLPSVSDSGKDSLSSTTDKPVYSPFIYNEGRPYEGDKATNRQSIYQPFSTLLRQGSQRQGSIYSRPESLKEPPLPQNDRIARSPNSRQQMVPEILEPGRGQSSALNATPQPVVIQPKQRFSILEPLLTVVPQTSVLRPEPQQIIQIRQQIESVPDEFGFIRDTVIAWDKEMKQISELHDQERHVRQGENEQRIDALFNENEIGYGDISELELEFKRSEAARKAEEDRAEYESFVSRVFEVVWARLHYEMDQLAPLYDICIEILNDATAGKEMFDDNGDRVPIAPAMDSLLILYQKLSVRHQKAFEAVLERDRRLKKTEVAPWYASGNIGKVKKIEKRFEDAEKKAILEFCGQRDERANLLMDVLDQNTQRGVGSNQDYMESVMQAVRKIALDVALGGVEEDTIISTDEVLKAKTITAALARSSEQIVQTFHVADMLLNSADYEASVASARLANADAAAFKRLREAKAKEDQKLVKDLEHRMSLIRGDTSRTQDEITKLLSLLGHSPAESTPPRSTSAPADPDRESRLLAALEEAKRRNASKEGV